MSTTTISAAETTSTRVLLACGVAAGPLFTTVATAQALTRDGYDVTRHPLSLLSLGDHGWVQIANFVVTGLLCVAFAVGVRRAGEAGWAGRWGPTLYGGFGLGLVLGGAFPTEPSEGFPPGVPDGSTSWHSMVHDVAAGVAIDLALVSALLLARRLRRAHQPGWATYSLLTAVVGFLLSWWPDPDGISLRLAAVVVLVLAWATALAVRLRRSPIGPLSRPAATGEPHPAGLS